MHGDSARDEFEIDEGADTTASTNDSTILYEFNIVPAQFQSMMPDGPIKIHRGLGARCEQYGCCGVQRSEKEPVDHFPYWTRL